MKRCSIYWLTIEPNELHERKVALLEERGFEVIFFKTLDSLTKELQNRRASIIIVGDEGPEVIVVKAISLLRRMPDIQGARLILSTSRQSPTVLRAAACEGFRDIIPIQMEDPEWFQRFAFSTSGVPTDFSAPRDATPLKMPLTLAIPARIAWMSPKKLWVESRFFPEVGTRVSVSGPLAQAMGCKFIELLVTSHHQSNLVYRFSEALLGNWEAPEGDEQLIAEAMEALKNLNTGERYKVFLAIQSPALRATLLKYLNSPRIEVHTALQKRSMVDEPRYFSPDLVFVEDRLARGEHLDRFRAMAANLAEDAAIVMIGSDRDIGSARAAVGRRKLHVLKRVPVDLGQTIFSEYLGGASFQRKTFAPADAAFIPNDHEFSLAELNIPAQLVELNRRGARVTVKEEIGNFGMARVKSPLFRELFDRHIYAKITGIQKEETTEGRRYNLDLAFCDLESEQEDALELMLQSYKSLGSPVLKTDDPLFTTLAGAARQRPGSHTAPEATSASNGTELKRSRWWIFLIPFFMGLGALGWEAITLQVR